MTIGWIQYQSKPILCIDYRACKGEPEMLHLLDEQATAMQMANDKVLVLSIVSGMAITAEFVNRSKKFGKLVFTVKTRKAAIVGVTGLMAFYLQGYITFTGAFNARPFADEKAALDWLVRDEE